MKGAVRSALATIKFVQEKFTVLSSSWGLSYGTYRGDSDSTRILTSVNLAARHFGSIKTTEI